MAHKIERIVAATSLNMASDPVVRASHALAKQTGAQLHIFHAFPLPMAYYGSPMGMTNIDAETLDTERALHVAQAQEQMRRIGLEEDEMYPVLIEIGAPHRMLLEAARPLEPDLLIVGSSEAQGPFAEHLGSTAERVLRKATCPVLVIKDDSHLPPAKVLAPVDLSELSESTLRWGLELLEQFQGAEPPDVEALFVLSRFDREGSSQFSAEQIDRFAADELGRFLIRLNDISQEIRPEVLVGQARDEILQHLENHPKDLVILGTHGRSGFERLLLGSVASEIARRSPTNILVVPPPSAAQGAA